MTINTSRLLASMQAQNKHLQEENKRMRQIEADRLLYEKKSSDAWNDIDRLKKVNDELREENERLRSHLVVMEGKVKTLEEQVGSLNFKVREHKSDPLLIEVAQVLFRFERKLITEIIDDEEASSMYLSDMDLRDGSPEVKQCEKLFGLKRKDLFALKNIITTIRIPRNEVAHPQINFANVEQWKTTLRDHCQPVSCTK